MRLSESNVSRGKGNNQRYQSSSSSSSSGGFNGNRDKKKQKQKQKRLDAICDQVYNGNRVIEVESNEGNAGSNSGLLRRSSRVRKAPAVLDVSPSPVKKRRRIDNVGGSSSSSDKKNEGCVDRQKGEDRLEMFSPVPNSENLDEPSTWKSRLRSRVNSVSFALKEKGASPRGKRKLFGRFGESRQVLKVNGMDTNEKRGLIKEGKSLIAKSTRAASEEEANISRKSEDEPTTSSDKEDGDDMDMGGRLLNLENEDIIMLNATNDNGYDTVVAGNSYKEVSDKQETEMQDGSQMKDELSQRRELDTTVRSDMQLEQTSEKERNCDDALEMVEPIIDNGGSRESTHDTCLDKLKQMQIDCMTKIRMRGGRRCGLCGGGSDGKAPKRLVDDHVESDEAYGGSSASEDTTYNILDGFSDEPGWLGGLLGPINDRFGIACVWVHQHCAVWSPEVYFAGLGCLKNVRAALCRGRTLKCSRCGRAGATIGCRVDRCPKTYHLPCARADGCVFDHHKYLITCTDHRHLFQPHGSQLLKRLKKLEIKKMKLEMRKHSHEASRKDFEMEEKWLENCGEDEEFLKREGKRLQRDLSRLSPVYIGGSNSESGNLYQGWESVAGLQNVIQCMKEVVILPLLYPEFFSSLGLTPPRGVLLHGHPGTGKTLVVRALIGSCARGDKRIAYFARKGADCLGKYVGDAERQLRLLFQVAEKSQPSIIFFDEIDGLAPCRSRQQDQTHNSVVSTLLALLDGLKSRGSVVVIGATNRPDAVDPALRRPGRFDREIYFPLPSVKDRAAILSLHTERWPKPVNRSLLNWIAQKTVGFAGADLQSLCTQAAMISLKRNCGWQELMMSSAGKKANDICPPLLSFSVEERDWLEALACAPPPCSRREAGTAANDVVTSSLQTHLIPCLLQPLSFLLVSLFLDERIRLPPSLYQAAKVIESVLLSALEKKQMPTDVWWCHLNNLIQEADVVKEIETNLSRDGLLVGQSDFANSDILDDSNNDNNKLELQKASLAGANANLLRSVSNSSGSLSGFRILIAGSPGSGQSHLASCILHGFVGRVEIQKVDLATISQEGYGDAVRGITHKLLKCGGSGLCIIYMPRIDLWAIETNDLVDEAESVIHDIAHKSTDPAGSFDATAFVSQAWNTFTEQVDSTYLSASVIVLATSEVPNEILPRGISQFFTSDVSNGKDSASMQHTIPRFLVKLDGNFDCDMAINSSVTELSRRLVQHYVQLIHYKTHVGNMSEEVYDTIEGDPVTENQERESGVSSKGSDAVNSGRTALNGSDQIQHYINSESSPGVASGQQENKAIPGHIQVPRPLNNRTVKGKPSLLCAISAFGYQILRYPHFSELCWATSKLKDGPYTEINGPWKVWPFNSCVIHPTPSVENVAVTRNSCNLNKRKQSGVVRGLVAIGMLAYRGAYSSVIEVSSEVRKVLEILVEETNAKILRGKDKFRFLRLLSQVAYLEDVVNSWAQTIQSLELHNQMPLSNTERTVVGSANNPPSGQTCIPSDSPKDSHEIQVEGQSSQRFVTEIDQLIDASNGYETGITVLEGPSRQVTFLDHSSIGNPQKSSSLGNLLATESTSSFHRRIEHAGNGKSEDHVIVNGLTEESAVSPSHVVCSPDKAGETAISNTIKVGDYCNVSSIANTGPSNDSEPPEDVNFTSSKKIGVSAMSGMTCLYSCCSGCLHKISVLVRKLLLHEKERKGSCWTVEDVHTAVSSWSVNLLSAVRELCVAESVECAESFENNVRHENGKFCSCPKLSFAHSKETLRHSRSTGNGVTMPMECSCDLESRSVTANIDSCTNLQSGSGLNFFFRNNVLIPSGSEKDVIFHCKYENFCLGSLVDLVLMIEPPLD